MYTCKALTNAIVSLCLAQILKVISLNCYIIKDNNFSQFFMFLPVNPKNLGQLLWCNILDHCREVWLRQKLQAVHDLQKCQYG